MFEKRHSAKWPGHDSAAAFFSEICIVAFVFKFGNSILRQQNTLYKSWNAIKANKNERHFGGLNVLSFPGL